ncbi:MAG TPA: ABC transporter permease [Gemmatimonadaceae bacterium]|nr:ABC transporter permease [Gemmatimonadaceae bacterium]
MLDWRREIRARLASGTVAPDGEHDLVEELAQHLEQEFAELSASIGPDAAQRQLLDSVDELARQQQLRRRPVRTAPPIGGARRAGLLRDLAGDALYALRRMRHAPQTAILTILTMGIGIGATTAIFSVVDAVALRPLPIPDADRVVNIYETNPTNNSWSTSEPNYLDFRDRTRSFTSVAAASGRGMSLLGHGDPVALFGLAASASYFDVFGARPLVGRAYTADNDRQGGDTRVVVLSEGIWRRLFGADASIVGKSITLDGAPYVVLGVMPTSLSYFGSDFWIPLAPDMASNRGNHLLVAFGKLKPGITEAQANADIVAVAAELSKEYPKSNGKWGARVQNITASVVGPTLPAQLMLLFAAVGFLLLLACVNVANLLLGKALTRQREISVRAALGADRGRIARQLITESMIVSVLGGVLGVAMARLALPLIQSGGAANVPRLNEVVIDVRVLVFALGVSVITGALFGLAPALHAARVSLQGTLREGSRSITGAGRRVRDALVAVEVALAVLLLVGAGLLGRSFVKLIQVPTGFAMGGALQLTVASPGDFKREQRIEFYRRVEQAIAAAPGVAGVGSSSIAPFSGSNTNTQFLADGHEASGDEFFGADWRTVSPGYFRTLGVGLLQGRLLDETDDVNHPSGRGARLDDGRATLARAGPDREVGNGGAEPAAAHRSHSDRRRRARRARPVTRDRSSTVRVFLRESAPLVLDDLLREGERPVGDGDADRGGTAGRPRRGPDHARAGDHAARGQRGGRAGSATVHRRSADVLRRGRAIARGDRAVRCCVVQRAAAHDRDGSAARVRRDACAASGDGDARRRRRHRGRSRRGMPGRARAQPPALEHAVRDGDDGRADVRGCGGGDRRRRGRGVLRASTARVAHGSARGDQRLDVVVQVGT